MGNFKIKEFRKAMRLYQDQLAVVLGLTQSNLSRYENNGVDLSEEQIDKLREKYGKDLVDSYITDSAEQVRSKSIPESQIDSLATMDMLSIIKKQNDTICQQVEVQNQFSRQIVNMNERLLSILEKISFN